MYFKFNIFSILSTNQFQLEMNKDPVLLHSLSVINSILVAIKRKYHLIILYNTSKLKK